MNYSAQIIYKNFTELYEVKLENELSIHLKEVSLKPINNGSFSLDLSKGKENYLQFPYQEDDLIIIQYEDVFCFGLFKNSNIKWIEFPSNEVINYLLEENFLSQVLPFINEEKHVLVNGVLNDLIRNDFSSSELNKKIKFLKSSILFHFLQSKVNITYKRVLLDETFLGDNEIENIAFSFRYLNNDFLKLSKISNTLKVLALLKQEKLINKELIFFDHNFFVDTAMYEKSHKLEFIGKEKAIKHKIESGENYIFEIGEELSKLTIDERMISEVKGKVFLYNGNKENLFIN